MFKIFNKFSLRTTIFIITLTIVLFSFFLQGFLDLTIVYSGEISFFEALFSPNDPHVLFHRIFTSIVLIVSSITVYNALHALQKERDTDIKYKKMLDDVNDSVFIMKNEKIIAANNTAVRVFDASSSRDLIGLSPPVDLSPKQQKDGKKSAEKGIKIIRDGFIDEEQNFFWTHKTLSGKEFDSIVTLKPLKYEGTSLLVIIRDITREISIQEELLSSQHRYYSLVNNLPDAVIRFNLQKKCTFANSAVQQLFGLEPTKMIGYSCENRTDISKEVCNHWNSILDEVINNEKQVEDIITYNVHGKDLYFKIKASPEFDMQQNISSVLTIIRNITNEIQAHNKIILSQKKLERSEEKLMTIFKNIGDGIIVLDKNLNISMINHAAERIIHYTIEEAQGMNIGKVFSPDNFLFEEKNIVEIIDNVVKTGNPFFLDKGIFYCTGGRTLCTNHSSRKTTVIEDSISSIKGDDGVSIGAVIVFRDITDRIESEEKSKELEQQLYQNRKMEALGQFSSGIAHDFNNIITVINGFTELLLDREDNTEEEKEFLFEIKKSCEKSSQLTGDLLSFSKSNFNNSEVININESILSTSEMFKRIVGEDIQLFYSLVSSKLIIGDHNKFSQIFFNLISNARDALQNKEETIGYFDKYISIKSYDEEYKTPYIGNLVTIKPDKYVCIEIEDNGTGINEEILTKIFEPFYSTKSQKSGTGLGLFNVYGIVKQFDGQIDIETKENEFTRFKIYFPTIEGNDYIENQNTTEVVHDIYGNEKILFVEDEEGIIKIVKDYLSKLGYTVDAAEDGKQGLLSYNKSYDLVITDIIMPEMGGIELIENIQNNYGDIKHIYTSGYSNSPNVQNFNNFIKKPYNLQNLALLIRKILDE